MVLYRPLQLALPMRTAVHLIVLVLVLTDRGPRSATRYRYVEVVVLVHQRGGADRLKK